MTRTIVARISVNDDMAIDEDMGTIDYLQREFGWLEQSGIYLEDAKILDCDDEEDDVVRDLADILFK